MGAYGLSRTMRKADFIVKTMILSSMIVSSSDRAEAYKSGLWTWDIRDISLMKSEHLYLGELGPYYFVLTAYFQRREPFRELKPYT